jgi:hypothetical protein
VSDEKQIIVDNLDLVINFGAKVESSTDYYAGGSIMPGRNFNANSYRYGFNQGSEKDDEISGSGNHFTTKFREGDTRLLRWWSVDPKARLQPWQSPYNYMDGNPVAKNDPDGDCPWCIGAIIGAAVEYGSQVAGNVIANGGEFTTDAFTDVDLFDIAVAAGEGALTGGASVITRTVVKSGIKRAVTTVAKQQGKALLKTVTAETVKAVVDVKSDGTVNTNTNVKSVVTTVATAVVVDKIGGSIKTKVAPLKTTSKATAVKTARETGGKLTTKGRLAIETKVGTANARKKAVNATVNGVAGKTAVGNTVKAVQEKQ